MTPARQAACVVFNKYAMMIADRYSKATKTARINQSVGRVSNKAIVDKALKLADKTAPAQPSLFQGEPHASQ